MVLVRCHGDQTSFHHCHILRSKNPHTNCYLKATSPPSQKKNYFQNLYLWRQYSFWLLYMANEHSKTLVKIVPNPKSQKLKTQTDN